MANARLTNLPNRVGGANTDPIGDNDFLIIANSQTTVSYRITAVGLFDLIRRSENVLNASETTSSIEGYFESINNGKGQVSLANVLGDIPGNRIQNLAIGTNQLANGAVTSGKIGGLQVTNAKLEEASGTTIGAVSTNKIRDRAVTNAKLEDASGSGVGAVSTNKIRDRAITSPKIADGQVTKGKLGANSVTEANIENGAVTSAKIANGQVTQGKLGENSVIAANIGGGQVIAGKLGSDSIFVNNIRDRQVFGNKIGINGVKEEHLGGASVSTRALADNSVTEAKIADNSVTREKINFPADYIYNLKTAGTQGNSFNYIRFEVSLTVPIIEVFDTIGFIDGFLTGGNFLPWCIPFRLVLSVNSGSVEVSICRGILSRGGVTLNTVESSRVFLILGTTGNIRDFDIPGSSIWRNTNLGVNLPEPLPYFSRTYPLISSGNRMSFRLELFGSKINSNIGTRPWLLQLKSANDFNISATASLSNIT